MEEYLVLASPVFHMSRIFNKYVKEKRAVSLIMYTKSAFKSGTVATTVSGIFNNTTLEMVQNLRLEGGQISNDMIFVDHD